MPSVRRAVLTVLSAWHGLAAVKNACDLGAAFGLAPRLERWGSRNFSAIEKLTAPANLPRALLGLLLAGATTVETLAAIAFARGDERGFVLAVALFGAFTLVDEGFRDYRLDETHREILVFILVCYLTVRMIPAAD